MNVLMVNANYASEVVGGGQRSLQVLAEGLVQRGHDVTVLSTGPDGDEGVCRGVRTVRVPIANVYWPFGEARPGPLRKGAWHVRDTYNQAMAGKLERLLERERPDVVHSNVMTGFSVAIWRTVKRRKLPLVHTLRDYYLLCPRSEMFRGGQACTSICWACLPFAAPRRRATGDVDAVVGNSRFILDRHLQLGAFRDTPIREVVYNAYDGATAPTEREPRRGPLRLGYLGRLDATKGIEMLLAAVSRLPADAVELRIAGSGERGYAAELERDHASERVTFLGFVAPERLFEQIDVLVVPSLWPEPLPRTALEAIGNGVPVIGSDRGGTPEVIREGETGFVFDASRVEDLERAIRRFLADPLLAGAMRPRVLEEAARYRPQRVVREYLEVYERALDQLRLRLRG